MRTLLILVDGMRPDAITDIPQAQKVLAESAHTMCARTVFPSMTLTCHMSLFHSVEPEKHGTMGNDFVPMAQPIKGLFDVLAQEGLRNAFFYGWEKLRDLCQPGALDYSCLCTGKFIGREAMNDRLTDMTISYLQENRADFTFLYLGYTDWAGHKYGWMSDGYDKAMCNSWENIEKVLSSLPEDYAVIITADHGGHAYNHGTDLPEDMTIPMLLWGKGIDKKRNLDGASIKDIAPTITKLLGVKADENWEGRSLL